MSAGKWARGDFGDDTPSARQQYFKMMSEIQLAHYNSTVSYNRQIIALVAIMKAEGILKDAKYKVVLQSLVPPNHIVFMLIYLVSLKRNTTLINCIFEANIDPSECELNSEAEKVLLKHIKSLKVS